MNGYTSAPLRKTHSPVHTHKTLSTHAQAVHTHTEFSQELCRAGVLGGRAARNNGLNSRREREGETEREGWKGKVGGERRGVERGRGMLL